jgi:hypothetical protein
MSNLARNTSLVFAAGCLGGLLNGLAVWIFGELGITWGLLFLFPLMKTRIFSRGFIFSLGPTLVQLFVIFPMKANKGVMGLDLGLLTPLFVVVFNAIWGWTAAIWLKSAGK